MPVEIGQPAPDFTLFDTNKEAFTLSDQKGKTIILLFFPLAFTSVCTAELCQVRDNIKIYENLDALPVGISVDSLHTLKQFKNDQDLNFPLLSDFNKEVSDMYESLYETFSYNMKGVSKRAAFVIDRNGLVQYKEVLENAGLQPDFEAVVKKVSALSN